MHSVCLCSCGRSTVRHEHNSKLIVTMPSGAQTSDKTEGEQCFQEMQINRQNTAQSAHVAQSQADSVSSTAAA